jgi:hypothetical protein
MVADQIHDDYFKLQAMRTANLVTISQTSEADSQIAI